MHSSGLYLGTGFFRAESKQYPFRQWPLGMTALDVFSQQLRTTIPLAERAKAKIERVRFEVL